MKANAAVRTLPTVEEVRAAYEACGYTPITGVMFEAINGIKCGCMLGALYAVSHPEATESERRYDAYRWADMHFGEEFRMAMQDGFDEHRYENEPTRKRYVERGHVDAYDVARQIALALAPTDRGTLKQSHEVR